MMCGCIDSDSEKATSKQLIRFLPPLAPLEHHNSWVSKGVRRMLTRSPPPFATLSQSVIHHTQTGLCVSMWLCEKEISNSLAWCVLTWKRHNSRPNIPMNGRFCQTWEWTCKQFWLMNTSLSAHKIDSLYFEKYTHMLTCQTNDYFNPNTIQHFFSLNAPLSCLKFV